MPIIVFEGPDESGKTTLAKLIQQQLQGQQEIPVEYQHSPTKEFGWSHEYDNYLNNHLDLLSGPGIHLQDRIPEVSESVYGTIRGGPRASWVEDIHHWAHHEVAFIFCEGPTFLQKENRDVMGKHIGEETHTVINFLYRQTYYQFMAVRPAPWLVMRYDRDIRGDWVYTLRRLTEWLTGWYPQFAGIFQDALVFDWEDSFPEVTL